MSGPSSQIIEEVILALKMIRDELFKAEEGIRNISGMDEQDADAARRKLADARWDMSHYWLNLPRRLSAIAVRNVAVREALEHMATLPPYPSVPTADSAVAMLEAVVLLEDCSGAPQTQSAVHIARASQAFPARLFEAMHINGDNKKSAAAKIGITTKTLTNLLHGKNTKAIKRELAQRYIDETKR